MHHLILFALLPITFALNPEIETHSKCPGPADKGPCNRNIFKYAYDPEKDACIMFIWGGCGGNDKNRFDSEPQCLRRCSRFIKSK